MPKRTFTPVHGLDRNLGYPQIYIDVRWCLYPGIPSLNKNVKSYYRVLNRYADEKFIEVVEHEKCLCNQAHSPAGYNATSNAYVHIHDKLNKTGNSINVYNSNLICAFHICPFVYTAN